MGGLPQVEGPKGKEAVDLGDGMCERDGWLSFENRMHL